VSGGVCCIISNNSPAKPVLWKGFEVTSLIEASTTVVSSARDSTLQKAINVIDELLSMVPTPQKMPSSVRHREGFFFSGSSEEITWTTDQTGKRIPKTYSLRQSTLPLSGVPINWKRYTELAQKLDIYLQRCGIAFPTSCNIAVQTINFTVSTTVFDSTWLAVGVYVFCSDRIELLRFVAIGEFCSLQS